MSREVEVKNIQMTASVPEDLQISLGKLTDLKGQGNDNPNSSEISAGNYTGLQGNQGRLDDGGTEGDADDGGAIAPDNNGTALDDLFWANTVDISEYYRLGKIIPASSIDGEDVFFTPDASGVGKTLKDGAKFYQVASLDSANFAAADIFKWNSSTNMYATGVSAADADEARTKLHALTNVTPSLDKWNLSGIEGDSDNSYDSADAWNDTNDDGYYVDIPVWFRSSSKEDISLSVDAFVTTNAAKHSDDGEANDDELYMAARAAVIYVETPEDDDNSEAVDKSTGLLRIRKDSFTNTTSINNYMYSTHEKDAVSAVNASDLTDVTYNYADEYDGTAQITVPGRDESTANRYGYMVKAVIRVWLEGEDPNCWNPNAGQDFNISLKFVKGDIDDETTSETGIEFPAAWEDNANYDQTATNLLVDTSSTVTIKNTTKNGVATDASTLTFAYDGNKWNQTGGSFEMLDGWTYKITGNSLTSDNLTGATEGTNSIAKWLKENVTTKEQAAMTYTITETNTYAGD